MTRTIESRTAPSLTLTVPEPLLRARDSEKLDGALRAARSGAITAGRGLGRAGAFIGRQGIDLAYKGAERAQRAPVPQVRAVAERVLPPEPEPEPSRRGRKILIALGIGAIAAGGVVFYKSRHRDHPPVAPAPPTLREAPQVQPAPTTATPSTPESNGKHAATNNDPSSGNPTSQN